MSFYSVITTIKFSLKKQLFTTNAVFLNYWLRVLNRFYNSTSLQNNQLAGLANSEGVVEKVNHEANSGQQEPYLPHRVVIRKNSESTRLRIVCDASTRKNSICLPRTD